MTDLEGRVENEQGQSQIVTPAEITDLPRLDYQIGEIKIEKERLGDINAHRFVIHADADSAQIYVADAPTHPLIAGRFMLPKTPKHNFAGGG